MVRNTFVWPGDVVKLKDLTLLGVLNNKITRINWLEPSSCVNFSRIYNHLKIEWNSSSESSKTSYR